MSSIPRQSLKSCVCETSRVPRQTFTDIYMFSFKFDECRLLNNVTLHLFSSWTRNFNISQSQNDLFQIVKAHIKIKCLSIGQSSTEAICSFQIVDSYEEERARNSI
ncbi:hypothetical protein SFRURICE_020785, partial [Spodoptera frugiperda]